MALVASSTLWSGSPNSNSNLIIRRRRRPPVSATITKTQKTKLPSSNNNSLAPLKKQPPLLLSTTGEEEEEEEQLKVLPSDESFSWANDNYSSFQRTLDVWSFVLSFRLRILLDSSKWSYLGGFTQQRQQDRMRNTASWLRERVLQLGPTFIKLGQLSSTRSDLFPREYVDELAKLQDRVPAFSPTKARNLIENELGAPVSVLFRDFEDRPIAAASLGQVHRAILHNGERVVVKVQRPGLKKLFDIDLRIPYFSNAHYLLINLK